MNTPKLKRPKTLNPIGGRQDLRNYFANRRNSHMNDKIYKASLFSSEINSGAKKEEKSKDE